MRQVCLRPRGISIMCAIACLVLALSGSAGASNPEEQIDESTQVLHEIAAQADAAGMANLLRQARGLAIFPAVVKVGFIVGGRHGEGIVLRRDPSTGAWFGPDFVDIGGASLGPQIGVQSTALLLIVVNEQGMNGFQGGKFTLGADVSVAMGPVGRHAEAATDVTMKASIYSYSVNRGLFAGFSLEGAVINTDEAANRAYWGAILSPDEILTHRPAGPRVARLITALQELSTLATK